jgi:hypothetical protein
MRDTSLPMSERLKAAEQLENRGMGKPKETVVNEEAEPEALRLLCEASDEDLETLISRGRQLQRPSTN